MGYALPILGAISGGQRESTQTSQDTATSSDVRLRSFEDLNKGRSGLEQQGYDQSVKQFADLANLFGQGPGAAEVTANTQYQNSFANQLQQMLGQMMNPQANIGANTDIARQLFAPQQTALNQQFEQQGIESNRLAARLGRAGNDPILRNKLAQEKTRQQQGLESQIGSYAQQLPDIQASRLMDVGGYLSNLRGGLASQALQNRQTLLSMGQQLTQQERNYRLNAAGQSGSQTTRGEQLSGGGTAGAINGGIAGMGQMAKMASMFMPGGGAGGGGQMPASNKSYGNYA